MRRTLRVAVVTVGSAVLVLSPASAAFAAPSHAPNRLVGTADCGADGTFDFVVNSGKTEATTWNPAFVTGSDGQQGLFLPVSFDLTFTTPFGTFTSTASKPTAPGPVSCTITGSPVSFPEATLTGTVTGTIVWTG
ncbi:MAG: hypothetical protein QOI76_4303 [Frankiales bacterium]|nr:hypothetical protein [Frankiales bacterium]